MAINRRFGSLLTHSLNGRDGGGLESCLWICRPRCSTAEVRGQFTGQQTNYRTRHGRGGRIDGSLGMPGPGSTLPWSDLIGPTCGSIGASSVDGQLKL